MEIHDLSIFITSFQKNTNFSPKYFALSKVYTNKSGIK